MVISRNPEIPQPHVRGEASLCDCVSGAVARFGARVASKLGRGGQDEEQLRGPVEQLFMDLGGCLGLAVIPYGEVRLTEWGVRPDFAVDIGHDRIGYIELKAPGTGVPPDWKKDAQRNRRQYARMSDLPNLLYSDGTSWRLVRAGQAYGAIVTLDGDLAEGDLRPGADGSFHDLVNAFLSWVPVPPKSLNRLIRVISGPCRMLRASVAEVLALEAQQPGAPVFTQLAEDWRNLLFPGLPDQDFPDAYAQTVTFALLLAREAGISFDNLRLRDIAEQLRKQHALMGRALHVLAHDAAVQQLRILDTLRVIIGAVKTRQQELLTAICEGPLITVDDLKHAAVLPPPRQARKAPRLPKQDELRYDGDTL